ncbi:MAG: hypothetical protein EBX41_10205, partial [Chitinophagia bacterium]|nr:hypothetical protein [Chitinophagia bacterium]
TLTIIIYNSQQIMKKLLTICFITTFIATTSFAQDKYISAAQTALSQNDLEEAKADIDKAMSTPETNTKPKALLTKAQVYYKLNESDKYKANNPWKEAIDALLKLVEIKPDYEKTNVNAILYDGLIRYFNEGITTYNDAKYNEAQDNINKVLAIYNLEGGNRFAKESYKKKIDEIAVIAQSQLARVAYSTQKYEDVIKVMPKVLADASGKSADNYIILLESYDKYNVNNNNKATVEEGNTISEARAAFPDNDNLKNIEINYYTKNNKIPELLKKLEEAAGKQPNNSDIQFNIGLIYLNMAFPKQDAKTTPPQEYVSKSEAAFKKAVELAPENAIINYHNGLLYYNLASQYNAQMNLITGTSKSDNDKYNGLKKKRDDIFGQALPYFEKCYSVLSVTEFSKLKPEDKDTYRQDLTALVQIYSVQNVKAKIDMYKAKLDATR